jgi:peptide/nickel transport system ATP-binding protein
LLIADEPTTALDVTTQAQILELIERLAAERNMAVILITHDLGLVAGFCDDVQVMYAGRVVERGPASEIFKNPLHPYTTGLLGSVTRLDQPLRRLLVSIPGNPPSLTTRFDGCAFTPRCSCAGAPCDGILPDLVEYSPGHFVACHFPGAASRQEAV